MNEADLRVLVNKTAESLDSLPVLPDPSDTVYKCFDCGKSSEGIPNRVIVSLYASKPCEFPKGWWSQSDRKTGKTYRHFCMTCLKCTYNDKKT